MDTNRWSPLARGPSALWAALLCGLTAACTGAIGGAPDPGGEPTPPPPGAGRLPDTAPTSGPIASLPGPSSRFLRLSHKQWENTMRDLLRLPQAPGLSRQFVNEGVRTSFDTAGGELEVSGQLWQDYNKAANTLATQIARDAAKLTALMPASAPGDAEGKARAFIASFGLRAFRRPLTDAEVSQHLALFRQGPQVIASGNELADGLELVIAAFLSSPHLLYRTELSSAATGGKIALTDYEVATRLSYGFLNTLPDQALFDAAAGKQLHTREQVLAQARRLIDSPAGIATLRDLHEQTIRDIDPTELVRDTKLHPLFKPGIGADMKEEVLAFINEVIYGQQKSVSELLTAPWTMIDSKLAPIYGVTLPAGSSGFVKVNLDGRQRTGLYTQLGFLAQTATDFNSRPIKRGVHLSEHLLCNQVPPPPPEANQTPVPSGAGKTNRQAFEAATEAPGTVCAGCHGKLINPLGFAFEHFDGLGRYREQDSGQPIDTRATYEFAEGNKSYDGAVELMKIVAEGRQAHECYSRQLFEYVYARAAGDSDGPLITELGRRSKLKVSIKSLLADLVATDAFLNRLP
jgi:hypothetical protein